MQTTMILRPRIKRFRVVVKRHRTDVISCLQIFPGKRLDSDVGEGDKRIQRSRGRQEKRGGLSGESECLPPPLSPLHTPSPRPR